MKFDSNSQVVPLAALILIAVSVGCSRSDLAAIKGRVNFKNGKPINRGTIEYAPIDPAAANQSGARIADGAYEIPREKGLRAGKYIVRISSAAFLLSPDGGQAPQGGAAPPGKLPPGAGGRAASQLPEELVSLKFNSESTLVVEVTDESVQTFDFEVE